MVTDSMEVSVQKRSNAEQRITHFKAQASAIKGLEFYTWKKIEIGFGFGGFFFTLFWWNYYRDCIKLLKNFKY